MKVRRETYTFQDFSAFVDGQSQTFVSDLQDELTGFGCKIDAMSAKSGYAASYSLNKKTIANYVFRKKGLIARREVEIALSNFYSMKKAGPM